MILLHFLKPANHKSLNLCLIIHYQYQKAKISVIIQNNLGDIKRKIDLPQVNGVISLY
jgi:hypothetical protein